MNFSKLAIKNIKQNFSNYFIYFISLTFSVMIFYIFCTLFFNEQFFKISQASISLRGTFKGTAIIVALFSFIFIWYSNSFFIASRKKEIATYCLLGMEKRQIGRLLFYENMILGTVALLLGIFIGTLFSKLFAMMLVYFMKFTSEIKFSINQISVYITLVLFFILFLINSIHSYRIIHRFKLIELFRAQKEGEKIPKTSYSITILSILVIVACYILSLTLPLQLAILFSLLIICMVVLGTYGLFHNLVALYIKKIIKNKKVYYNRMNLVSFSQILYRIKSNATVLATIAVLAATTISAIGTTYALYKTDYALIKKFSPFSFSFLSENQDLNNKVENTLKKYPEFKVISTDNIKIAVTSLPDDSNNQSDTKELLIISESQYNGIANHQNNGNKAIGIINKYDCFYIPSFYGNYFKKKVGDKIEFNIGNLQETYNIAGKIKHNIFGSNFGNETIVIRDDKFNDIIKDKNIKILSLKGYMINNAENSKELTNDLASIIPQEQKFNSCYNIYSTTHSLSGPLLFIGLFLGALFFLSTGSIIYFKQLIEAEESKDKYAILHEIGVSKNEIRHSVSKQQLIMFVLPLVAAISHSTIVLNVFQKMLGLNIFKHCLFIIIIYIAFYAFFYFITVNSYTKIVTRK